MPELRRCCWYGIVGAVLLSGVFYGVARYVQNRDIVSVECGMAVWGCLIVALAAALRWRIVVDPRGITRWRFFRPDTWTWDDFASGRICKRYPLILCDPQRPWWRRRLNYGYLATDDCQVVSAAVNAHYRLPPPPVVPDSMEIKYGFRNRVAMDRNGVHITVSGAPRSYLWREVQNVHITRMDPVRRDFSSLEMTLPDQTIQLQLVSHQGGTSPTWRGAAAEEINEYLFQHLAPEQIDATVSGEPFKRRSYIEKRLKLIKSDKRQRDICIAVVGVLLAGTLIYMAIDRGVVGAIVMAAFIALAIGPLYVFQDRSCRKYIAELESLRNSLPEDK